MHQIEAYLSHSVLRDSADNGDYHSRDIAAFDHGKHSESVVLQLVYPVRVSEEVRGCEGNRLELRSIDSIVRGLMKKPLRLTLALLPVPHFSFSIRFWK
jgi:hypothetical protein